MKLEISPPLPSSAKRCGVILDIEQYHAHMPHTAECFLRATSIWLDRERLGLNTESTVWLAPIKWNIAWSRDVMEKLNKNTNLAFTFTDTFAIQHVPSCMIEVRLRRSGLEW